MSVAASKSSAPGFGWRPIAALLAGLAAPASALAAAPGPGLGNLLQLVIGLLVVIAAVLVLGRWLPRLQGVRPGGGGQLRVVDALPLGQKERVVLIEVGGRQLLVGVTANQISALHTLDQPLPERREDALASPANGWLQRVLARRPS